MLKGETYSALVPYSINNAEKWSCDYKIAPSNKAKVQLEIKITPRRLKRLTQ